MKPLPRRRKFLLASIPSDAHTWNLVFLQQLIQDLGHEVVNVGACVPVDYLVEQCRLHEPEIVVLSTVNGHGYLEAPEVVRALRAEPALDGVAIVIGGKLGVHARAEQRLVRSLLELGCDGVFTDGASPEASIEWIASSSRTPALAR
jgi:methylaspartate mutase sigma subunit